MLTERLRSLLNKDNGVSPHASSQMPAAGAFSSKRSWKPAPAATRHSRGLEQFFFNIRDVVGLSIMDTAGANQENIDFLTNLGHRLYSQDIVRSLDDSFGRDPSEQTNATRIEHFFRTNFDHPSDTFDGVLMWDSLQFMGPALLAATVEKLYDIMRPKSYLLAFVTANERVTEAPSHSFRIIDNKTLLVAERELRPSGQVFNNRNLEKLFSKFESIKFFLTRENLREVIVRR